MKGRGEGWREKMGRQSDGKEKGGADGGRRGDGRDKGREGKGGREKQKEEGRRKRK